MITFTRGCTLLVNRSRLLESNCAITLIKTSLNYSANQNGSIAKCQSAKRRITTKTPNYKMSTTKCQITKCQNDAGLSAGGPLVLAQLAVLCLSVPSILLVIARRLAFLDFLLSYRFSAYRMDPIKITSLEVLHCWRVDKNKVELTCFKNDKMLNTFLKKIGWWIRNQMRKTNPSEEITVIGDLPC